MALKRPYLNPTGLLRHVDVGLNNWAIGPNYSISTYQKERIGTGSSQFAPIGW